MDFCNICGDVPARDTQYGIVCLKHEAIKQRNDYETAIARAEAEFQNKKEWLSPRIETLNELIKSLGGE